MCLSENIVTSPISPAPTMSGITCARPVTHGFGGVIVSMSILSANAIVTLSRKVNTNTLLLSKSTLSPYMINRTQRPPYMSIYRRQ